MQVLPDHEQAGGEESRGAGLEILVIGKLPFRIHDSRPDHVLQIFPESLSMLESVD
jgi:hypothetical protein